MRRAELHLEDVKKGLKNCLQAFKECDQDVQIHLLAKYVLELMDCVLESEKTSHSPGAPQTGNRSPQSESL